MKKIILVLLFISSVLYSQGFKPGEVRGMFLSIGLGPQIPVGEFSDYQNIGIGFDVGLSYTDNLIVPIFLYAKGGYQHYPGTQELYNRSEYSSLSSNVFIFKGGARYFFKPIIDQQVLLMPMIEAGFNYGYFEEQHLFKKDSGRNGFMEKSSKFGFHVGAGFSMFLLDAMAYYNYFHNSHFVGLELRLRIPVYVKY